MNHTDCLHPKTSSARTACRRSRNRKAMLVPLINEAFDVRFIEATRDQNYDHAEYERTVRVTMGLLIAFTDGDEDYAKALNEAWLDSNEHVEYYLTNWTRDSLVYWAGIDCGEEIELRLGIHWSQQEGQDEIDTDHQYDLIVDAQLGV